MSKNWFKHIKSEIINRGEYYYLSDQVQNLKYEDGVYTAEVDGTDIYYVEVEIDGNELINSNCDCYIIVEFVNMWRLFFLPLKILQFEYENFDFSKAFFGIISFVKQETDNCFGTVYREYRSFWVGTLYLVDELNEIFNRRHPSLFNEFAVKYRRFSEFRGKMSKFR